jgi:dihydrofolate reductase
VDQENQVILENVDVILLGATTYRMFVEYWPTADNEPVADLVNSIPKVVLSSTLDRAPWGEHAEAEVLRGDAVGIVADLKQQPGRDIMLWGSLTLAQSLLRTELVDEIQLRVCPIVLGSGRSLFGDAVDALRVELVEAKPFASGILSLRYRPLSRRS